MTNCANLQDGKSRTVLGTSGHSSYPVIFEKLGGRGVRVTPRTEESIVSLRRVNSQLPALKKTRNCPSLVFESKTSSSDCVPRLSSPRQGGPGLGSYSTCLQCSCAYPASFPQIPAYFTSTQPSSPLPRPLTSFTVCPLLPSILPSSPLPQAPFPPFHLPFPSPSPHPSPFFHTAFALLLSPCFMHLVASPLLHPSYTLVFFRKLSDLFHTILSSLLASQAHGILSAPCSLAAQGPDSTIALSLPLTQLPLLPSQNKSKAAQALGADTHECSHFCRNPIPLQASLGTSLSPSARLPLLCEAG